MMQMRRSLNTAWTLVRNGWTWHLTAVVVVFAVAYVLVLLDYLGLI